jgi:hypothetical protein
VDIKTFNLGVRRCLRPRSHGMRNDFLEMASQRSIPKQDCVLIVIELQGYPTL